MKKRFSFRRLLNILSTIFLILIIGVVIFVFIIRISGNVPSVFGLSVFRVRSDSMEPTLLVNDVILDRQVAPEEIKKGDIITYMCEIGELKGQTITHRVIEDPVVDGGIYHYQTKGDKEGASPDAGITYDQVLGKYAFKIPWLDRVYTFFLSPYGLIVFILIIMVLFGYEMISLLISYRTLDEKDDDYYEPKPKKKSKKRK